MLSQDITEAINRLTNAARVLTTTAHEIHWAASDLRSSKLCSGDQRAHSEPEALEIAARHILPVSLSVVFDDLEAAYDLLASLRNNVKPLQGQAQETLLG